MSANATSLAWLLKSANASSLVRRLGCPTSVCHGATAGCLVRHLGCPASSQVRRLG